MRNDLSEINLLKFYQKSLKVYEQERIAKIYPYITSIIYYVSIVFLDGLTMEFKLTLSSQPSSFSILIARLTIAHHQVQFISSIYDEIFHKYDLRTKQRQNMAHNCKK